MNTFEDLFVEELQDLFSAETQILEALPLMAQEAQSEKLKKAFETHRAETQTHIARLEEIAKEMDIDLEGKECMGMKGLLEEGGEILASYEASSVKDAAMIGAAQKVEHYEIATYGTAIAHAKLLGQTDAAQILLKTFEEEEKTDKLLTKIAEGQVNEEAADETMGKMN